MQSRSISVAFVLAVSTGCVDTEDTVDISPDDPGDVEQPDAGQPIGVAYAYSRWWTMDALGGDAQLRWCRTATRVNWEFRYNTFARVATSGSNMSRIVSNIAGVSSGSKYRTHNGSTFMQWDFYDSAGYVLSHVESLQSMPGC